MTIGPVSVLFDRFVNKKFYGMVILSVTSLVSAFAQEPSVTVQTDDDRYQEGDTILISGRVTPIIEGTPVLLQIIFEGNFNIVEIGQIQVAQDGTYSHTVIAGGALWKTPGTYLVRAFYGEGNRAETALDFVTKENFTVSISRGSGFPGCEVSNQCYVPYRAVIDADVEVIWRNDDIAAHTVTSGTPEMGPDGLFDSEIFLPDNSFSVDFDGYDPGAYPYFCKVHPWMEGVILVTGDVIEVVTVNILPGSFTPGCEVSNTCYSSHRVVVDIGNRVVWQNDDSVTHTVTSGTTTDGANGLFDSGLLQSGNSFSVDFDGYDPGEYPYFDQVYPWMQGVVVVQNPTQDIINLMLKIQQSTNLAEENWTDESTVTIAVTNSPRQVFYRLKDLSN